MATKPEKPETSRLGEANRQLRIALNECRELLRRTEGMLERSQQDNDPPPK